MSSSYWGYWLTVFGVAIVGLSITINNLTTTTTQDFYSVSRANENALLASVNFAYYRDYNEVKIDKEKYYEIFIRDLSSDVRGTNTFDVNFYGVYEAPPKASVEVTTVAGGKTVTTRDDAVIQVLADKQGDNSENNPSPGVSTNPTPNPEPSVPQTPTASCNFDGVNKFSKTIYGYVMDIGSGIYTDSSAGTLVRKAKTTDSLPEIVTLYGTSGNYLAIETSDGECGYINQTKIGVDLREYLNTLNGLHVSFPLPNASSSIYKTSGHPLNLGKLYSSDYKPLARYAFAGKLLRATQALENDGYTLLVYDAYRPTDASQIANETLNNMASRDAEIKKNITQSQGVSSLHSWEGCWFLACGVSAHNTGSAVDISLIGGPEGFTEDNMPSDIHELSVASIKYYGPDALPVPGTIAARRNGNYYAKTMTEAAIKLDYYMTEIGGLNDLASEWWHFQDTDAHHNGTASNFWSNVNG